MKKLQRVAGGRHNMRVVEVARAYPRMTRKPCDERFSPTVYLYEDVVKPLVPQSVGDVELKDHERFKHVLDAAHTSATCTHAQEQDQSD